MNGEQKRVVFVFLFFFLIGVGLLNRASPKTLVSGMDTSELKVDCRKQVV